jgi:cell division protein FtsN
VSTAAGYEIATIDQSMSRDYQPNPRRSQGPISHPMMTGVFIGVLVGLVLALAVALYLNRAPSPFVSRDKAAEPDKTAAGKAVAKAEPDKTPAQAAKGSEPKTRLDFYTILPGKEEVVPDKDVSRASPSSGTSRVVYYLQAGAFQNASDADNLKARLALAGLEAQIQTATLPDKSVWHRVRMGPYSNAQDLDKVRAALKENKIDNAVIKVNEPLAKR